MSCTVRHLISFFHLGRLTCILLATKLENLHLAASDFTAKIPNCQPNLITEIELALLEVINFNLLFFHPHSALTGLALVLKADRTVIAEATKALDVLVMTDALLLETPSHLALATFWQLVPQLVEEYIETILKKTVDCDTLLDRLRTISQYIMPPTPFNTGLLKDIDRRLHQARSSLKP